jgi:hypothetical protein
MKVVEAELRWRSKGEGGRSAPPSGPTYSTVARFASQGESWKRDAWSLHIEFIGVPDGRLNHRVKVRFLVEGAPEDLLKLGSEFDLMEGTRVVAHGRIVG